MWVIGYRFYSRIISEHIFALDDARPTPAVRRDDGGDFVPTPKWVVFGHHFAAIAGAGPLVGPILAAQFGWLPGTLWILVGVVLGGAVQDLVILPAGAKTIADAERIIFNARLDAGLIIAFSTVVCIVFADSLRAWWRIGRGGQPTSSVLPVTVATPEPERTSSPLKFLRVWSGEDAFERHAHRCARSTTKRAFWKAWFTRRASGSRCC